MYVCMYVGLGLKQKFRGFTPEYHAFHVVTLLKELDKWICSHSAVKLSWDEVKVVLGVTLYRVRMPC